MVLTVGRAVRADVGVDEPEFAATQRPIGIGKLQLAGARRLYFAARQHHARLEVVGEVVLVPGATVVGEYLYAV